MLDQNRTTGDAPFSITISKNDPLLKKLLGKVVKKPAETVFGLDRLNRIYRAHFPTEMPPDSFADRALEVLHTTYDISDADRARIPRTGPVVLVANHPFGAIEGIIMASLLSKIRPDFKLMANYMLGRITPLRPLLLEVNPFGGRRATRANIKPMKEALAYVRGGGMLIIFPSGEVAHRNWKRKQVTDPKWSASIGRFIRRTGAPVLPVYFDGSNSRLFQIIGLFHKRLRTVMLPRELLNKANRNIPIRVGQLIDSDKLGAMTDDRDLIEYVRMRTFLLAGRSNMATPPPTAEELQRSGELDSDGIVAPQNPDDLRREIDALPVDRLFVKSGDYEVYCAQAEAIPRVLMEIGRLREVTFREVGEGTGQEIDLDRYDEYYLHLFIWNRAESELVGAYRLGPSDLIVASRGVKGLYTRSLYKYKDAMLDRIGPALELGRSFVSPKYQRNFAPLHLLWKGIGQYILRHPRYRCLFGPVSISARYHSVSMRLMVNFLKRYNFARELAKQIKPTKPLKMQKMSNWDDRVTGKLLGDLDEISALVSEIEADTSAVPILLKHYLRLGGRVLGFNVDRHFSDVVDALVLVDLLHTDRRILGRYFGKEEAETFLNYHRQDSTVLPA